MARDLIQPGQVSAVSHEPPSEIQWTQLLQLCLAPLMVMWGMLNFAPFLPVVREEFGLTNSWTGALAAATILTHTILQLPGGHISDTIGPKRTVGLGLAIMGLSTVASGLAPGVVYLLICRLALGVGTAITFIAGLACVQGVVPATKRVVGQGLFGAAANVGVLLLLLLSDRVAHWGGWRGTFMVEGLAMMVAGVVIWTRLKSGERNPAHASASWRDTFSQSHLYTLGLAHILTYGVYMAMATWIATFLFEVHGIGLQWAGPLAAFLPAAAVLSRTAGGALTMSRERPSILLSCLITAVCTGALPFLPGLIPALIDLFVLGWFAAVPFGAIFSYSALVSTRGASGRSLSLVNFVGNLGALAFPPAVGLGLDLTHSFAGGFGVLAGIGVVGTIVVTLALPRARR